GRGVEPGERTGQRRLAAARRPDDRGDAARLDAQIQRMQDREHRVAARDCLGNLLQLDHEAGIFNASIIGRSADHTVSATICAPSTLGWMPSAWFRFGTPATLSSRNGTSVSLYCFARSRYTCLNDTVYSGPKFGGASIPVSSTAMCRPCARSMMAARFFFI